MAETASAIGKMIDTYVYPVVKEKGARLFADIIDGTYSDSNGNLFSLDSYYAQLAFVLLILGVIGTLLTLATADLLRANTPDVFGGISQGIEAIGLDSIFGKVDEILGAGAGLVHQAGGSLAQAPQYAAQAAEDYLVKRVGLENAPTYSQIRRK